MNKFLQIILTTLVMCCNSVIAQREYNICDSTFYHYNNDTTIIAGRKKLYTLTSAGANSLYNFTDTDSNQYIRDFDIVHSNLWYIVVGNRYIGGPTKLFKSTNRGQSWNIDTNHYTVTNPQSLPSNFLNSINNLQHLGGDTLVMFMSYYESGIIYSTNLGITWTKWFDNLITHYQGMFSCDSKYYIYGFEGDAFRPWMFSFNKNLIFTSDSSGAWNSFSNNSNHPSCSTSNDTINCIYAATNLSRCETFNYFEDYLNDICTSLTVAKLDENSIQFFPNPATNSLTVKTTFINDALITIYNTWGSKVTNYSIEKMGDKYVLDIKYLPNGLYVLQIENNNIIYPYKYLKE